MNNRWGFLEVTITMTVAGGSFVRRWIALVAVVFSSALPVAVAQVPIPLEEQIRLFNSMPPAQQNQLIRGLQRQLPPAQRDLIIGMLQGGSTARPTEPLDGETAALLNDALTSANAELDAEAAIPRFKPGDTVVLEFSPRQDPRAPSRTSEQQERVDEFEARLADGNPYKLDGLGRLLLPGVAAISLAGLNVEEATVRVLAETSLRPFTIVLWRLPLEPVGTDALKPFGYDIFQRPRTAFAPDTSIPVPVDYVVGPGDTINVQLFGARNDQSFLEVNRDGTINLPEIGPVNVSGLSFVDMRNMLTQRLTEQIIGVRVSVTLGELRSISVFVLGDVQRPSTYTVGGLSTVTNALSAGGGVTPIGSLRNVAVRRDGQTVATLDLYALLLQGDTSADVRLQPGDVIFVPPIGPAVAVDGAVRRPAIYEVKGERTVGDLIALAGGLNANADRTAVKLERVVPSRGTTVEDVDLSQGAPVAVRDGDVIRVLPNLEQLQSSVRLEGNVFQPGPYHWFSGMRLRDVLPGPELVKPMSDLNYVLIRRELAPNVAVEVVSVDLWNAWQNASSSDNIPLEPRDTVYVFNIETGRGHIVQPIIEELGAQAAPNTALPIVRVGGQVRAIGEYPLERGMRISDLLRAGGGLTEAAYATQAELTRYEVVNGEYRETALMNVDLAAVLRGDAAADFALTPYDYLNVKEVSRWRGEEVVTLRGEVAFPGTYPIRRGETLSSVLARAGGLTDLAFPEGSVFTRVEARQREREQLEVLARRIERDLAAISISDPSASQTITTGQSLITQLRNSDASGRLVIRLDSLVAGNLESDIILKDGDVLMVPDQRQEVTVLGEVQYATSHLFENGLSRDEYIAKSGGLSQRADERRIYVVRANGEVLAESGSRWFRRGSVTGIRPGDTVVVPLDVDQPLARWAAITQIVYNLAIAAAAVNSF